jgi:hypothetical protein
VREKAGRELFVVEELENRRRKRKS